MLVLLVRHGATRLNTAQNTVVRGWKDEPLLPESRADILDTAEQLREYNPQAILSSDFMRDSQTAQILATALNISDITVEFDARTWDVGTYSGEPEDQVNAAILDLYQRPYERPPGSQESFNDFSGRWNSLLDRIMQRATIASMRPIIMVTHGRNIALTDAQFNFQLPEASRMPMPAGYGILAVDVQRKIQFDLVGESECVCVDV